MSTDEDWTSGRSYKICLLTRLGCSSIQLTLKANSLYHKLLGFVWIRLWTYQLSNPSKECNCSDPETEWRPWPRRPGRSSQHWRDCKADCKSWSWPRTDWSCSCRAWPCRGSQRTCRSGRKWVCLPGFRWHCRQPELKSCYKCYIQQLWQFDIF